MTIVQTRVYYDPDSGDIVQVHRLAVPEGESLDAERIEEWMSTVGSSIKQRHGRALESLEVRAEAFDEAAGSAVSFRTDVQARVVIREDIEAER